MAKVWRRTMGETRHMPTCVAALPDGVLERLGGRDGPGGAADDQLRRLVVAHAEVAPDGLDRLGREAAGAGGEVGARAAELDLGGLEVDVAP